MSVQIPSLILPYPWILGTETELINDLLAHTSVEFPNDDTVGMQLEYKTACIMAVEVVAAGVPGVLNWWVELGPYLSATPPAFWAAIGGGGGALPPTVPFTIVPGGVLGRVHTQMIPWTMYMPYARVVVQTPVAATPATDYWAVQVLFQGWKDG